MRNKYAGRCIRCGAIVAKGKGYPELQSYGRWAVRCVNCVGKGHTNGSGKAEETQVQSR